MRDLLISSIQVTLVTASGEILTVNSTTNSDLFWGVRGGGGNFGVVTNFVLKLHPQPRMVFAGPVVFPLTMLGTVVSALEKWFSTATPLANATLVFAHGPDGNPATIVTTVYHGGEEEGKTAFKPIFDLGEDRCKVCMFSNCQHTPIGPVANKTSMIPYEALNGITNHAALPGSNWYYTGIARTHLTPETAIAIHDHLLKMRASHPLLGEISMVWQYYPMMQKIMSVKPDAMAFRMRTPHLGCLFSLKLDGSVKDEEVKAKAKELVTEHRVFCEKHINSQAGSLQQPGVDRDIAYGNYGKWFNSIRKTLPLLT